jgi:hypothetical protein
MDLMLGLRGAVIPQADLITGLKTAAQAGFSAYERTSSALEKSRWI